MSVINMVHNLKELFHNYVLFIKIGNFYECYNDDAIIMNYLFGYKIKNLDTADKNSGFPVSATNKIFTNLENRYVNYLAVDKSHNYEETDKVNFKGKNKYHELLVKANEHYDKTIRIDKISKYLMQDSSKLSEVENIIYER